MPETKASLKKIFDKINNAKTTSELDKAMDVLQEIVTNVQFANDEGDPGMGIELGLNAFCFGGSRTHGTIRHLLSTGYDLVNRPEFGQILRAHLGRREKEKVFKIE